MFSPLGLITRSNSLYFTVNIVASFVLPYTSRLPISGIVNLFHRSKVNDLESHAMLFRRLKYYQRRKGIRYLSCFPEEWIELIKGTELAKIVDTKMSINTVVIFAVLICIYSSG